MNGAQATTDERTLALWPGIEALINEGRFVDTVDALGGAKGVRELIRTSRSPEARLRLARILSYGGNPRGAQLLTERTAREWPDHPECRAEWLLQLSGTSPVEALLYLDRHGEATPEGLPIDMAASWLHGRALVATQLRLFDDAHRISEEARERIAGHPWSILIGASTLLAEDRREEARLEALRREFAGGEPERRGDERNYARYLERVEALRAAIARTEADVAAIRRELSRLAP
jgi:hypothetical protein